MKTKAKMPTRIKVNVVIFVIMTILFAVLPMIFFTVWFPNDESGSQYEDSFSYILHDICPCSADEENCMGYYACGPDKANITYNLDTAPADILAEARRDHYFERMISSARYSSIVMRQYLIMDICYLMSLISLVSGVIYWNHNRVKA